MISIHAQTVHRDKIQESSSPHIFSSTKSFLAREEETAISVQLQWHKNGCKMSVALFKRTSGLSFNDEQALWWQLTGGQGQRIWFLTFKAKKMDEIRNRWGRHEQFQHPM